MVERCLEHREINGFQEGGGFTIGIWGGGRGGPADSMGGGGGGGSVQFLNDTDELTLMNVSLVTDLFQFEHVLVEVVLQLLVGEVDAKLLKAVLLKVFESKDVENANRIALEWENFEQ